MSSGIMMLLLYFRPAWNKWGLILGIKGLWYYSFLTNEMSALFVARTMQTTLELEVVQRILSDRYMRVPFVTLLSGCSLCFSLCKLASRHQSGCKTWVPPFSNEIQWWAFWAELITNLEAICLPSRDDYLTLMPWTHMRGKNSYLERRRICWKWS